MHFKEKKIGRISGVNTFPAICISRSDGFYTSVKIIPQHSCTMVDKYSLVKVQNLTNEFYLLRYKLMQISDIFKKRSFEKPEFSRNAIKTHKKQVRS